MRTIHISNEIVESQKVRSDFLKWKLVVIATLATVGFGISDSYKRFELAFALIPFASAYIDALCLHLNLRIYSIGRWHTTEQAKALDPDFEYMKEYEKFTDKLHECGAYNLEKWTIFYSSLVINSLIIVYSITHICDLSIHAFALLLSSVIGLILTVLLNRYLKSSKEKIKSISNV